MSVRKEDIIFVINPSLWYENMYPSGILCLSGYLQEKGFDNIILDSKISFNKVDVAQREALILGSINELKPKIVCFSSSHREFNEVVRLNNAIKKMNNDIFTIVGGSQPTSRASDFLDNGFEFVCIGEGEVTLSEFLREVFNQSCRWADIKGLAWKDKDGNVFNQPRGLMSQEDINSVVRLPYENIDKRYFDINIGTIRGLPLKGALLLTSRGVSFFLFILRL